MRAATLWDLGLDFFGLYEGLDRPSTYTHGLGIVGLQLQPFLIVLFGKVHVPQELEVHPLKKFVSL